MVEPVDLMLKGSAPRSFASIVKGSHSFHQVREEEPEIRYSMKEGCQAVSLSPADLSRGEAFLANVLILKFSSGRPALPEIRSFIEKEWGLTGDFVLGPIDLKHILLRLASKLDVTAVLSRDKLYVRGYPFRVQRWSADFDLSKDSTTTPVWMSLPGLPWTLYEPSNLKGILKRLGDVLRIDEASLALAKPKAARVSIELDISKPLPEKLWVSLPSGEKFWQPLEYEKPPLFCPHCCLQGHIVDDCRKLNKLKTQSAAILNCDQNSSIVTKAMPNVDDDGFQVVLGKKKVSYKPVQKKGDNAVPSSSTQISEIPTVEPGHTLVTVEKRDVNHSIVMSNKGVEEVTNDAAVRISKVVTDEEGFQLVKGKNKPSNQVYKPVQGNTGASSSQLNTQLVQTLGTMENEAITEADGVLIERCGQLDSKAEQLLTSDYTNSEMVHIEDNQHAEEVVLSETLIPAKVTSKISDFRLSRSAKKRLRKKNKQGVNDAAMDNKQKDQLLSGTTEVFKVRDQKVDQTCSEIVPAIDLVNQNQFNVLSNTDEISEPAIEVHSRSGEKKINLSVEDAADQVVGTLPKSDQNMDMESVARSFQLEEKRKVVNNLEQNSLRDSKEVLQTHFDREREGSVRQQKVACKVVLNEDVQSSSLSPDPISVGLSLTGSSRIELQKTSLINPWSNDKSSTRAFTYLVPTKTKDGGRDIPLRANNIDDYGSGMVPSEDDELSEGDFNCEGDGSVFSTDDGREEDERIISSLNLDGGSVIARSFPRMVVSSPHPGKVLRNFKGSKGICLPRNFSIQN